MRPWIKRLFAGGLAVLLALSVCPLAAVSEDVNVPDDTAEQEPPTPVDADFVPRAEREVLDDCMRIAAQNERLTFYVWDWAQDARPTEDLFAVENRETGYVWWSSPINALGDEAATPILRKELASAVVMTYGKPAERSTATIRSGDASKCTRSFQSIENGVEVTYSFPTPGITIPVQYVLCEDYLRVSVETERIEERHPENADGRLLTDLTLLNAFGAADDQTDGSFFLPDGCGALVHFHNGKTSAAPYSQPVYGADTTAVPTTQPADTEQIYLPVYGILLQKDAMLTVIEEGDETATLHASVSGQSHSSYALAGFSFTLRSMDTFYMGAQSEKLTVFESGGIKTPRITLRYYPLARNADTEGCADLAARYRQYLTEDAGVTAQPDAGDPKLYLDFYGGARKPKNVLGIPVTRRECLTSFSQMQEILTTLDEQGAAPMVVSLHNWTSAGMDGEVDVDAAPSGTLGGKGDFAALQTYLSEQGIPCYPVSDSCVFSTGQGYFALWHSAMRISGVSARILTYERAFGTPDEDADTRALLTPSAFAKLTQTLTQSCSDAGITGVCPGDLTTLLYGDYGKKRLSRTFSKQTLTDCLSTLQEGVGSVLAQNANAYALPYVDHLTDVPLSSSRFDLFDEDVPFLQLVLHGVIPYATTAVNGSADADALILRAAATGASVRYDLIGASVDVLKNTEYDTLYYAHAADWLEDAARTSALLREILSPVAGLTIRDYRESGDRITTTYEDGTVILTDLAKKTVTCGGNTYYLCEEGGTQP